MTTPCCSCTSPGLSLAVIDEELTKFSYVFDGMPDSHGVEVWVKEVLDEQSLTFICHHQLLFSDFSSFSPRDSNVRAIHLRYRLLSDSKKSSKYAEALLSLCCSNDRRTFCAPSHILYYRASHHPPPPPPSPLLFLFVRMYY